MTSPILWQNAAKTMTLIDMPRSIAAAQGTVQHPCHDEILSITPNQAPFTTNEPNSAAKKAQLTSAFGDCEVHERYAETLRLALSEVHAGHTGDWCLPRTFVEIPHGKRKLEEGDLHPALGEHTMTKPSGDAIDATATLTGTPGLDGNYYALGKKASEWDYPIPYPTSIEDKLVSNLEPEGVEFRLGQAPESDKIYRIPPRSSLYLGDCHNSTDIRAALRAQAEQEDSRKDFDFVLLDPPWPNRSVRRTHKTPSSTYGIASTNYDIGNLLFGMDLDMLMAEGCLVGIWITNKPAIRRMVLGEGGLFDTWGVRLCEEWVWLKTTVHGKPVTPIDAAWRKPYEVLLLGRRCCGSAAEALPVQTRVIIGVPDLHSRKPCIRELIEPIMRDKGRYRALEVFARYLVAGWWSWGNECVKFNSTEHWRSVGNTDIVKGQENQNPTGA